MVQHVPIRIPRYRGLYQRVAKKVGVHPSYVSRVARGERHSEAVSRALKDEIKRLEREFISSEG